MLRKIALFRNTWGTSKDISKLVLKLFEVSFEVSFEHLNNVLYI